MVSDATSDNIPQLVLKIQHFSYLNWTSVLKQFLGIIRQVNLALPSLKLLPPSEEDMRKLEKSFCFAAMFDERIEEILATMPADRRNAKRENLQVFKDNELFWADYQKAGLGEGNLIIQIGRLRRKALRAAEDKEGKKKQRKARKPKNGIKARA